MRETFKCLHPFKGDGTYCQDIGDDGMCMWERDDHLESENENA